MNIAATLCFNLLQAGFAPRRAHRQGQTRTGARSAQLMLPRSAIMRLENRPLQLCVLRGWVWITRDGCPADMVLGAGEVFEQRPGEPVLVQALEDSELLIASAGPSDQNARVASL